MGDAGHGMEDDKADGPATRKKRLKTAEKVAIIGGVFSVLAAAVTGTFVLASSHTSAQGPNISSQGPNSTVSAAPSTATATAGGAA